MCCEGQPLRLLEKPVTPQTITIDRGRNGKKWDLTAVAARTGNVQFRRNRPFVERLARLQPSPDNALTEQAAQGLYGLCWAGIIHLLARLLAQAPPVLAYPLQDTPQALFDRVTQLAVNNVATPGLGARLVTAHAGPRNLARLLRHVADGLEGAGIANLPALVGAAETA